VNLHIEAVANFAREHVASRDIDPVYPVARYLQRTFGRERALWHSLVYVAYYNIASCETAFDALSNWLWADVPVNEALLKLPTGTERRNLRTAQRMMVHLSSLAECSELGGFDRWLREGLGPDAYANWNLLDERLQTPWGNGRWASYKTREVLWKVNDFPLAAPDTGMANSSGPRDGLAVIFPQSAEWTGNDPNTIGQLEALAWWLRDELQVRWEVNLPIEELETVLCDYHALVEGRYYVGHDIDQMLEQTTNDGVGREARERILEARAATLPHAYLGELNGWWGVDSDRKRTYRDERVLLVR
jgi:hypothetical protein